jgi:hypothetical protein
MKSTFNQEDKSAPGIAAESPDGPSCRWAGAQNKLPYQQAVI